MVIKVVLLQTYRRKANLMAWLLRLEIWLPRVRKATERY